MFIVSIIIPTHNRSASLRRTLDALCKQSYPASQFEVHVVADGCVDNTVEMLQRYQAPFSLRVTEQPGKGSSAARNRGANEARGALLLFLDDDVEPLPELVAEHVRAHHIGSDGQLEEGKQHRVVVAPYPPSFEATGFLQNKLRHSWEGFFEAARQPGHRFTYKDLLSGNVSIAAHLFAQIGGFREHHALQAHEDYELGVRLLKAGVSFSSAPAALARHHETSDLQGILRRKRHEGKADVFLARWHPDISETLPFFRPRLTHIRPLTTILLKRLAFAPPPLQKTLFALLRNSLSLLERLRLREEWSRFFALLQSYAYWCGIVESAASHRALTQLLAEMENCVANSPKTPPLELDLRAGLESAERRLDEERPMAAHLRYGARDVGLIPAQPGAEPLRGAHLRPMLATTFAIPFLEALALDSEITSTFAEECADSLSPEVLAQSIRCQAPWVGRLNQHHMWFEQYTQWNEFEQQRSQKD